MRCCKSPLYTADQVGRNEEGDRYGLATNHGFVDGNKRSAWVAGRVFLADNGLAPNFDPLDAVQVLEGVAAGRVTESELALWIRSRLRG